MIMYDLDFSLIIIWKRGLFDYAIKKLYHGKDHA